MMKYEEIGYWPKISPDKVGAYYKANDVGNDYFYVIEKDLMVNYDCTELGDEAVLYMIYNRKKDEWDILDLEDDKRNKDEFRTQLKIRSSRVWRAMYGEV